MRTVRRPASAVTEHAVGGDNVPTVHVAHPSLSSARLLWSSSRVFSPLSFPYSLSLACSGGWDMCVLRHRVARHPRPTSKRLIVPHQGRMRSTRKRLENAASSPLFFLFCGDNMQLVRRLCQWNYRVTFIKISVQKVGWCAPSRTIEL